MILTDGSSMTSYRDGRIECCYSIQYCMLHNTTLQQQMVETLACHLVLLFIGKKIQSDMNKTHPDLTYKCLHKIFWL